MRKKKIILVLKKLRRKIWIERIINSIIKGLMVFSILIFIFMIFTQIYPVVYGIKKAVYIFIFTMIISILIGIFKRPKLKEAALVGDKFGLEDRLITYIEYKEENTPLMEIFLEDLKYILENFNPLKKYKIKIKVKRLFTGILFICISLGIYYLPTGTRGVAAEREEINKELTEEAREIKKILEEEMASEEDSNIKKEKKEILKDLEKKIERTFDFKDGAGEIANAQRRIEELYERNNEDILRALAGIFQGVSPDHRDLENALMNRDIENTMDLIKNKIFTEIEQKKILENLKAEEKNYYSVETKEELNKIKKKLENKEFSNETLRKSLEEIKEKKALKDMEKDILSELQESKERFFSKSKDGIEAPKGEKKLSALTKGEKADLKSGEKSREESSELLAGGFGNEAQSNTKGIGRGGKSASGEGTGEKAFGELEKNSQDKRLGDDKGDISNIRGEESKTGNIESKSSNEVFAVEGEKKDLRTELIKYENQGMKYIYKQNIPLERKDLVIKYFMEINGGKTNGEENN
ncbi:coiled-coil domain-containing protein [Maledivibacter halophilus]|uniref:Uncharacterized protein n=1 Tax=Maledivibacter halophilus TaxID=36842 RepID=A0A1T5J2Z3_9FIRM|nr:hypothetical protein [Maledivibacter halophilus]SKC45770.1 hypothetical protein SAMN02194393_00878 [Maledivibacter halophilus]